VRRVAPLLADGMHGNVAHRGAVMLQESEPLLQALVDNRVLLPPVLCRAVCKSWALAIDSRRTKVLVSCLEPEGGCRPGEGVALGRFLSKLPSLQAVHFAPSFRKVRQAGEQAASTPRGIGQRRREREEEEKGGRQEMGSSGDGWDRIKEREAQEDAYRTDRAAWGGRQSMPSGGDGTERMTLREMEQKRIDTACAALQTAKVTEVAIPFCFLSPEQLGAVFQSLGAVRSLDISGNWFKVEGARILAKALQSNLATLTQLDISSNDVTEAGLEILAEALRSPGSARLEKMRMGESSFASGARVPRALSSFIRSCPALSSFHITSDPLKRGFGSFFAALASTQHLTCLHMTQCSLEAEAGADLAERLALDAPVLQELSLQGNQLSSAVAEALVFSMRDRVAAQGFVFPLTTLDLSNNLLGPEGCAVIAVLLRADQPAAGAPLARLRHLNLAENQIRQRGGSALADALRENATLETLVLHSNALQAGGATALAESLSLPTAAGALTSLDVSHNALDSKGMSALAVAAASCPQLQELDVSFNNASRGGLMAFGEAYAHVREAAAAGLRGSPHLRRLNLAYNSAVTAVDGDGETPWLASILSACPRLEYLDISYNVLGDGPALALADAVKDGRASGSEGGLRVIGLRGVGMHAAALQVLLRALSQNHRSSLRLEALHIADNYATEEFGALAAVPSEHGDRVAPTVPQTALGPDDGHAAAMDRGGEEEQDDLVELLKTASESGAVSNKEREKRTFSTRRAGFERYYGEQVDVWLGGGERMAEREFDRDAHLRVLLQGAGARGLAPHQVSLTSAPAVF
jgi:Ran GTPase-activating protein (RanGAP) involved in mRNA processing and transport